MTVAPFRENVHHIGLGPTESAQYGFFCAGQFERSLQQYGSPTDFGGQRDLVGQVHLSRWTMDDFSGGAYSQTWGKDPSMFSESQNILPTQFDRTLRTVPPLIPYRLYNTTESPMYVFQADGYLYGVFPNRVSRIKISDGTYFERTVGAGCKGAWYDPATKQLNISIDGAIYRLTIPELNVTLSSHSWPLALGTPAAGFLIFAGGYAYQMVGKALYAAKLPDNAEDSPNLTTDWVRVGRPPGTVKAGVAHNGAVYLLVSDVDGRSSILSAHFAQGLLPVADFPYNFRGDSIESYAGRIYVGGSGTDITGVEKYGELYEITGASIRLVRTFAPQSRTNNAASRPKTINDLLVHEGLLFFGDSGRGLVAYDVTTDALYGGPMLEFPDGQRQMRRLFSQGERLWAWVNHPLDASQNGFYRVAAPGDTLARTFEAKVITADFIAEPDRLKRWSEIKVLTRGGGVHVDYSVSSGFPSGDTFTHLPNKVEEQIGESIISTVDLTDIPPSSQIRFRFQLPRGTDLTSFTEFIAFTCGFVFLETGRFVWQFTVNGTENVEQLDGSGGVVQNVHDIVGTLATWAKDKEPLIFTDLDRETHKVQITGFREAHPVITKQSVYPSTNERAHEAFTSLTLVEV